MITLEHVNHFNIILTRFGRNKLYINATKQEGYSYVSENTTLLCVTGL